MVAFSVINPSLLPRDLNNIARWACETLHFRSCGLLVAARTREIQHQMRNAIAAGANRSIAPLLVSWTPVLKMTSGSCCDSNHPLATRAHGPSALLSPRDSNGVRLTRIIPLPVHPDTSNTCVFSIRICDQVQHCSPALGTPSLSWPDPMLLGHLLLGPGKKSDDLRPCPRNVEFF